jgi:hypothetical protein
MTKIAVTLLLLIGSAAVALAGPRGFSVPEIDPGSAVTGLTLLGGVTLIVRGRRKTAR